MKIVKSFAKVPMLVAALFIYVSGMQVLALSGTIDTDIYFLVNNGWQVLQNKAVPHELFDTIHEGYHTIMQQWLVCVIDAVAYNLGGYLGVKIISVAGYCLAVWLLYMYIRGNVENSAYRLLALSLVIIPFGIFMNGRPWEASICVICAFMYFSDKYCKSKNPAWLVAWPILSMLSSNIQAAMWGLLLCFGLTYVFPNLLTFKTVSSIKEKLVPELEKKKVMWLFYFLMIPAACINPNGTENVTYLANSIGTTSVNARLTISEMSVPNILSISGVSVILGILFLVYYLKTNWEKCDWQKIYLAIGCGLLGVMHLRNAWIASLGMMPVICSVLNSWQDEQDIDVKFENKLLKGLNSLSEKIVAKDNISVAVITIMTAVVAVVICVAGGRLIDTDGHRTPVVAADYLDQVDEDIVLYADFNTGAYMQFRGYDVYMHAQPELYGKAVNGKKDIYEEYQDLVLEPDFDYEAFVDAYGFNYLCIVKKDPLYTYVKYDDNYEIVVDSEDYVLVKKNS